MPEQLEIFHPLTPLGSKPSTYDHTLFFGIRPPAEPAGWIMGLAVEWSRRFGERRWTPLENLHLSMHCVREARFIDPEAIRLAKMMGNTISMPPFELVLYRIMTFGKGKKRAVVLVAAEGAGDVLALRAALLRRGRGNDGESESARLPHVTLWYTKHEVATQPLARPIRWTVNDFWLIHSHTGQGRHEWPGHWQLQH